MRLLAFAFLLLLGACSLPQAPPPAFNHDDGYVAVDQAFAGYGPVVLAQAHCIAQRESGHNPAARNGIYAGIFQLSQRNYAGAIDAAAAGLGRAPDFFDPYVNAAAAAHVWEQSGWRPWSTAPGCA